MITEKDIEKSFKLKVRILKAIKPCPFCGGAADTRFKEVGKYFLHYVQCNSCDVNNDAGQLGPFSKKEAISNWNARYGQPRTKHDDLFDELVQTVFREQ